MRIDELLKTNFFSRNIDDMMLSLQAQAQREAKQLVDQWHRDLKQNPNIPHPALVVFNDVKAMLDVSK
jgi:hypothetical protein